MNDKSSAQEQNSADVDNRVKEAEVNKDQLYGLLYEALETEKGESLSMRLRFDVPQNDELISEWEEYLEQTRNHVTILVDVLTKLGLNPDQETPGRTVVRHSGLSLVRPWKSP
jgi:hypothetical protein